MASWRKEKETEDSLVARTLDRMRSQLACRFTVDELAKTSNTSRAALARRFVHALGVPPLTALRELRMERACQLLEESDEGLSAIASAVGYDSEFSFSRAFFRHIGERPGRYRRGRQKLGRAPLALAA